MAKSKKPRKLVRNSGKKQYVGISRDHSGSMSGLIYAARNDYNDNINAIRKAADENGIDTIVSVVKCGVGYGLVEREVVNSNISTLQTLTSYSAEGQTPLFDSVGELIDLLSAVPDYDRENVTFLVMVVTDGQENYSKKWTGKTLGAKIRELQATDRWTFVFRVPPGYAQALSQLGIPAGNIQEWEQTTEGLRKSTMQTMAAVSCYYAGVSRGVKSTDKFYADLKGVTKSDVKAVMTNISSEVRIWPVQSRAAIRDFVESKTGNYKAGAAFYQLTKPEKAVQDYKMIVVRNKKDGSVFAGQSARDILGLPTDRTIKLAPGDHGTWDIYVQSTSVNRVLMPGTNVLYWKDAAKK